jgi:hypothetical protein
MAGIPAQVGEQGASSAARHQTGRRVPGPDRRAGPAPGLRPERAARPQARRPAPQRVAGAPRCRAWRYAPRHRTRRRAARGAMVARPQARQSVSHAIARHLRRRSAPAWRRLAWLARPVARPQKAHTNGSRRATPMGDTSLPRRPAPRREEPRFARSGALCAYFRLEPQPTRLPVPLENSIRLATCGFPAVMRRAYPLISPPRTGANGLAHNISRVPIRGAMAAIALSDHVRVVPFPAPGDEAARRKAGGQPARPGCSAPASRSSSAAATSPSAGRSRCLLCARDFASTLMATTPARSSPCPGSGRAPLLSCSAADPEVK